MLISVCESGCSHAHACETLSKVKAYPDQLIYTCNTMRQFIKGGWSESGCSNHTS